MSGLLRQPVNPLNATAPATATAPVMEASSVPWDKAAEAVATPPAPLQQTAMTAVQPAAGMPTFLSPGTDDGFGQIEAVSFGAYPRVKLDNGMFWFDAERLGQEFLAQFVQKRDVMVYRDTADGNDKNAQVFWTSDNQFTHKGEDVASILNKWRAAGKNPTMRVTAEVVAIIQSGAHAGKFATLSIPAQSRNKLHGYNNILLTQFGKKASQVITRVFVGDLVKSGQTSFTPWAFELAAEATPLSLATSAMPVSAARLDMAA